LPLTVNTQNHSPLTVKKITKNKEKFMDILLIGDEEETMVLKYLENGNLYALYDLGVLKSVCITLPVNSDTVEKKNLATYPKFQNQGYATFLLNFIFKKYKKSFKYIILGTGENEKTLNFYKKFGFFEFSRIKNFFLENYPHPIIENGTQLIDMIYLKKEL